MMLYRSFVIGLLGAIALLVASLPGEVAAMLQSPPGPAAATPAIAARSVVHAHARTLAEEPDLFAALGRLALLQRGEAIVAIDGDPGRAIEPWEVAPGRFVELEIDGAAGRRSCLVLFR